MFLLMRGDWMPKDAWKIVFEGALFDGQKQEIVKERLASLFKADLTKIEPLFHGDQVTIKSGIDYQTALKFQTAFQKTGAKCRVIQMEELLSDDEKNEIKEKTASLTPAKARKKLPSTSLSTDEVLSSLQDDIDPIEVPRSYSIGLVFISALMMLLPLLYIALIMSVGYGTYYHATENFDIIVDRWMWEKLALLIFAYILPIVFGTILTIVMIKPIFAPRPIKNQAISLNPYKEELLHDFVRRISEIVRAPMPRRIDIDCETHASARFDIGVISIFNEELVLRLGLPLAADLNARQFAGVLARELGRFSNVHRKRLVFIIRSMDNVLSQVVSVRDAWDVTLVKWSRKAHRGYRIILSIVRFFVWLTRKMLWIFMKAGRLASYRIIRRMELLADTYQTRVAGSKDFVDTHMRLSILGIASKHTSADLGKERKNNRLADNLPDLILTMNNRIPSLIKYHCKRRIIETKTGLFNNRPSDRDRIIHALRENAPGILGLEIPAKHLFSDFDSLSREATIEYYQNKFGIAVPEDKLVSVEAFSKYRFDLLYGDDGLESHLFNASRVLRPLPIQSDPGLKKRPPKERIESLFKASNRAKKWAPQTSELFNAYETAIERERSMVVAKLLLEASVDIDAAAFQVKDSSEEVVKGELHAASSKKSAADSSLQKVESLIASRFAFAFSLLETPRTAQYIQDAKKLKNEYETHRKIYLSFSSSIELLDKLYQSYASLISLGYHALDNRENDALAETIKNMKIECKEHIANLYGQLTQIPHPFGGTHVDLSVAQYTIEKHPEKIDEAALLRHCGSAIDRLFTFHDRLLQRLASIVRTVERAMLSLQKKQTSS
jgi:hypothetical protein